MSFKQPNLKYLIKFSLLISLILNSSFRMEVTSQTTISENFHTTNLSFPTQEYSNSLNINSESNTSSLISLRSYHYHKNNNSLFTRSEGSSNRPISSLIHSFISISTSATPDTIIPYWMRSMQYGSIPLAGLSVSGIGSIKKDYNPNNKFDWAASFEGRINAGSKIEGLLIEGYAKVHIGAFQLKAGRSKEIMGLVDSTLSTGAFAVSGNALGIPKIEISIPEFTDIPFTNGLLAIKGNFAHGWFGEQKVSANDTIQYIKSHLHQKSLYARIGKKNWKINFYGGFNHEVMWGNEYQINEGYKNSAKWDIFWHVITGTSYRGNGVPGSKVGNHLGSVDQALEIKLRKYNLLIYHQFFYEAGALAYLDNIKDGISGISITPLYKTNGTFTLKKIVFEFFNTKSQGGEVNSKSRPSSYEDYYNNFQYLNGWSYKGENIGNPLITSRKYINQDLPYKGDLYFRNTRVSAIHIACIFKLSKWILQPSITLSKNFGTYRVSPVEHGRGDSIFYHDPPYFGELNQFSGVIEANKNLNNGIQLRGVLSFDEGNLLNNSIGGEIKILKSF